MSILRITGEFEEALLSEAIEREVHPTYGVRGLRYFSAVFGSGRTDASFAVSRERGIVAIVPCSVGLDDHVVDYWGLPIKWFIIPDLTTDQTYLVMVEILDRLYQIAREHSASCILLRADDCDDTSTPLAKLLTDTGFVPRSRFTGLCDLTAGEEGMRKGLRKSFKSLLNWGRANLDVLSVNASNPNRELFELYQDFHLRISGRATRSQASWDLMFDWVCSGMGELLLGYFKSGALVAGTLVLDGTNSANYASGVYDREHFDRPLAHWPLWQAMLNAKERGRQVFDLGDIPPKGTVNDKEFNVGYFKKGFATSIHPWTEWQMDMTSGARA